MCSPAHSTALHCSMPKLQVDVPSEANKSLVCSGQKLETKTKAPHVHINKKQAPEYQWGDCLHELPLACCALRRVSPCTHHGHLQSSAEPQTTPRRGRGRCPRSQPPATLGRAGF